MPVLTVYGSTSDGELASVDTDYDTCHGAADAHHYSYDSVHFFLGQRYYSPAGEYSIFRVVLFFDASALPDDAKIKSATLSLYGEPDQDHSETDFDITVVDGSDAHDPITSADYGALLDEITSYGTLNTLGFITTGYNNIVLNAAGIAAISKTGVTQFAVRGSTDISKSEPSDYQYVACWSADKGDGYKPKLTIAYTTVKGNPGIRQAIYQHVERMER